MTGLQDVLQHPSIWRASDARQQESCAQQTQRHIPTGFFQLDKELPLHGWPKNELSEWLSPQWGIGELQLLSPALAQLSQQQRWIVWVSPPWQPYGPALVQQGVNISNVLLIYAKSDNEKLWAMETCLQSGACSMVLGWPNNVRPQQIKRLHLAARKGNSWCLLMRHSDHAQHASPAPLRIMARVASAHIELQLIKRRGSWASHWIQFPHLLTASLTPTKPSTNPTNPIVETSTNVDLRQSFTPTNFMPMLHAPTLRNN
ncbi:MAG: translesion DNA synthesis-associated protein ImuA [Pseudomonadales bacterium]|nr:translesion DNA synthesis-associated protein ImuA [Pseudomonadales bacterium]